VARRKKDSPKAQKKDFQNSPFRSLKGVAVQAENSPEKAAPQSAPPVAEKPGEKDIFFEREMRQLGVKELPEAGRARALPAFPEDEEKAPRSTPSDARPDNEEALFLAALGNMGRVFQDELPDESQVRALPQRMKQLRQGKLTPQARLDLHGLSRCEARDKVRYFLEDAVYQGHRTVLVVTGRGNRSPDGPVLRDDMERYLSHEAGAWVVEWGRAPKRFGGEGALVVFLRGRPKK
jgi:DNA-nicking Smr family endonuclease